MPTGGYVDIAGGHLAEHPWWTKLLLAIGVGIFILEVLGVVNQIGLASLNLLALGFLFTIYGSLAELGAKLDAMNRWTVSTSPAVGRSPAVENTVTYMPRNVRSSSPHWHSILADAYFGEGRYLVGPKQPSAPEF